MRELSKNVGLHRDINGLIQNILSGPNYPEKDFVLSKNTYKQIYKMAAGIRNSFSSRAPGNAVICLCAQDRSVVAAALIATLNSSHSLVIPYSYSKQVLSDVHAATGFETAVCDTDRPLPAGVRTIIPDPHASSVWTCSPRQSVLPDTPWLTLFTGGSTGKPKIWSKTARNLLSEAVYLADKFGVSPEDRFLATVPPYHIYGLLHSVLIPFIASAGVVDETPGFPLETSLAIKNRAATILISIPLHFRALTDQNISRACLRLAVSSGAMLPKEDAGSFFRKTGIQIVEIYGSTETGGIATRCRAKGENYFTTLNIVDWKIKHERLFIRSEFVSAEIKNDANGFFKTGDRVVSHADNSFMLLGRADGIVKVGGKRVDLEDIKETLKKIKEVRDAAVISMPGRRGRDNIIVAAIEGNTTAEEIKQTLADKLESCAMPRKIRIVNKLPVTAAGKQDWEAINKLFKSA